MSANISPEVSGMIDCPVLFSPLTEAVNLDPCAHKINEAAARMLEESSETFKCPLCRCLVSKYYPDHYVREMVKNIIKIKKNAKNSSKLIEIENSLYNKVDYPKDQASYEVKNNFWEVFFPIKDLIRCIEFVSNTSSALFKEITLLGYEDGSISLILICFAEDSEVCCEYFNQLGFDFETGIGNNNNTVSFKISGIDDLKHLYNILIENNEFSEEPLEIMRSIIREGSWTKITPLSEREARALNRGKMIEPLHG